MRTSRATRPRTGALTTTEFAVLTVLTVETQAVALSGYDLLKIVERTAGYLWRPTKSHLYAVLPRLVERGLATRKAAPGARGPERQLYRVTTKGDRLARAWLEEPAPCDVFAATRLGTVGTDRYALCSFDPGFGNLTKELRKSDGGPFTTVSVPPREGITTGFAVSPEAPLVAATGRDWSFVHRGSGEKWSTPLTLGGPPFEDLAFSDARHATFVRGGPGQEFAEVYRTDDAGLNWKLLKI